MGDYIDFFTAALADDILYALRQLFRRLLDGSGGLLLAVIYPRAVISQRFRIRPSNSNT
jgi:hypothetical protein